MLSSSSHGMAGFKSISGAQIDNLKKRGTMTAGRARQMLQQRNIQLSMHVIDVDTLQISNCSESTARQVGDLLSASSVYDAHGKSAILTDFGLHPI